MTKEADDMAQVPERLLSTVHRTPQAGSDDRYRTSVLPESMGECFPRGEVDRDPARRMIAAYDD